MKYSVITPTYNRPNKLIRCVESVLNQNKSNNIKEDFDFELIIVNDSPLFDYSIFNSYLDKLKIENFENFSKIKYFINKENMGVNYSRNLALDYVSKDTLSDYVIFLDDDDWLSDDALKNINNILRKYRAKNNNIAQNWLVTNISLNNISLTKNNTNKSMINYFFDYLIMKKFWGDVTHTIKSEIATRFRFSNKIKNGEEWTYFIQIPYNFLYENINTKNVEEYQDDGLNSSMQSTYKLNTKVLWRNFKDFKNIQTYIYMIIRSFYLLIK